MIKVEHPARGDESRAWGPDFWEGSSVMFYAASTPRTCSCRACGPVTRSGSASAHDQTAALGLIQPLPEPTVALPLSVDGERVRHRRQPPRLGEHTDEILRGLGYTDAELEALAADGVIRRVKSGA